MSMNEIERKIRELKELQVLIEEAEQEAEADRDSIKEHIRAKSSAQANIK